MQENQQGGTRIMEDKDWLWALRINQMEREALESLARNVLKEKIEGKYRLDEEGVANE